MSLAVVAGGVMMTTDAHAQTNTERLITTVDNTNSIMASLSALADAVANGFASVLEALGMVQANTDAIMAELGHVEGELQAIDSDLADVSSNVASVQSDVAGLSGSLADVNSNIQSVQSDLAGLAGTVGGSAASFASLADTVGKNAAAINDLSAKLDMISEAVGAVQETVEMPPEDEAAPVTGLHSGDGSFDVLVSAFGDNKADAATYTSTLSFSCESDVFLGNVKATNVGDGTSTPTSADAGIVFLTYAAPEPTNNRSTVTADGRAVFDSHFPAGASSVSYVAGQSFDLQPLSAGSELTIKVSTANKDINVGDLATIGEDNDHFTLNEYLQAGNRGPVLVANASSGDINSLSKQDAGKVSVLGIDISWYSTASDAGCTLTSPTGPAVNYSETDEEASGVITAVEGATGTIKTINALDFTCTDSTQVTSVALEGIPDGFHTFVALTLTADAEKSLKFDAAVNGKITVTLDDPLEFNGGNVTLSGKIPALAAVATITYDTVEDGVCNAN